MGDLLIRDISEAVKQDLIARAHRSGRSLSEEAKSVISKGLAADAAGRAESAGHDFVNNLQQLFADIPADEKEEFSRIMDEIEQLRKKDLGRPFSFEE